jgi:hypothetical protein
MREDSMELSTEPTAEITHRKLENTAQTATETTPPPPRESHGGYESSRFNAVGHGVLSAHTVMPWEDGPTEDHLVEEIAGIIWRKCRLRLAEAASYRRGVKRTAEPWPGSLSIALVHVEPAGPLEPIIDAVTATPSGTAKALGEWKRRRASAQSALEILSAGKPGSYEAALAELDEGTRTSWQEQLTAELEYPDEDQDPDVDEPPTAAADGLAEYLECSVLPRCEKQLGYVENRPVIRAQVLGDALDFKQLERVSRYEVHLDRKLERMLTMLLRLQSLRRSKELG